MLLLGDKSDLSVGLLVVNDHVLDLVAYLKDIFEVVHVVVGDLLNV